MKTFALAALASVAAALAENFTIDPLPELTTCVPANLTWHGGVPPYTVQIRGGSHPVPLYTIRTDETFYTWVVNVTAGISLGGSDSTGHSDQTQLVTVHSGDTSCIPS